MIPLKSVDEIRKRLEGYELARDKFESRNPEITSRVAMCLLIDELKWVIGEGEES